MFARVISALLGMPLFIAVCAWGPVPFALMMAILAALGVWEMRRAYFAKGIAPNALLAAAGPCVALIPVISALRVEAHYTIAWVLAAVFGVGSITLASFVKFFGVSFLSRTSTLVRERASKTGRLEVGWTMQVPQVALAACCVLLGLAPSVAFSLLRAVLDASRQGFGATLADAIPMTTTAWLSADVAHGSAVIAPLILAALLGSMLLLSWLVSRINAVNWCAHRT